MFVYREDGCVVEIWILTKVIVDGRGAEKVFAKPSQLLACSLGLAWGGFVWWSAHRVEVPLLWVRTGLGLATGVAALTIVVLAFVRRRDVDFSRFAIETVLMAMVGSVFALILTPTYAGRPLSKRTLSLDAAKRLSLGFLMYAGDHDDLGPLERWSGPVGEYLKETPFVYPKEGRSLAFNSHLVGKDFGRAKEESSTVLLFEFRLPHGSVGTIMDAAIPSAADWAVIAFVDGHVKGHDRKGLLECTWVPVFGAKRKE